ncbi:MAG: carbohydrate binding domain-containing protein, partial [Streptosporangiaceae bacterium]
CMSRIRYWFAAAAASSLLAAGLFAAASAPASASAGPQAGPFEVGNLLSYANSDFEGTIGNWAGVSNATLTDDTSHSFLHNDSLLDTTTTAGSSSFRISGTPDAIDINVTPGDEYRVGAYFKLPADSGETVQFSLNCYDSAGDYLGVVNGTTNNLLDTTKWQYSEDDITVTANPDGCAYVQGAPKVTLGGLPADAAVNMDEAIFAPYRAALIIGAKGENGADGNSGYDASDWILTNWTSSSMTSYNIGPLQSDKEFYDGSSTSLNPTGGWAQSSNICYEIEQSISNSANWPACVINYQTQYSEPDFADFFQNLPAAQMVVMVFHGEPEASSDFSSGSQYVSDFDTESLDVRDAAVTSAGNAMPNVFVAADSTTFQYASSAPNNAGDPNGPGNGCPYIPPTTSTDFYLADHYNQNVQSAPDNTLPTAGSPGPGQDWSNWLSCVQDINKPVGLAEYGLDCHNSVGPDQQVVTDEINADNDYLEAIPGATQPTIMWEYWYSDNGGTPGCVFSNAYGAVTAWQNAETQNGGG